MVAYEKDASDFGNNFQILNFTGSFCNILKSDESLCSKTINPFTGLLLNLLNYQDGIEKGLKLCWYFKDKVLWIAFSAIYNNYREIHKLLKQIQTLLMKLIKLISLKK